MARLFVAAMGENDGVYVGESDRPSSDLRWLRRSYGPEPIRLVATFWNPGDVLERALNELEPYFLGDGWYSCHWNTAVQVLVNCLKQ